VPDGVISIDDPRADDVRALLERHLAHARATTVPEEVYALDVDALLDPAVTFFSYRAGGELPEAPLRKYSSNLTYDPAAGMRIRP